MTNLQMAIASGQVSAKQIEAHQKAGDLNVTTQQAMPKLPVPATKNYYRCIEYFAADQMHAYALSYAESLRTELEEARAALEAICIGAPTKQPEGYEGDNHGDTAHAAIQEEHFRLAQIAHAALSNHTKEQSND